MAARLAARAARASARLRTALAREQDEGLSPADSALLEHVERLRPEGLEACERPAEGWTLAAIGGAGEEEEEDGWLQAEAPSCAIVLGPRAGAGGLAAAAATAEAVERELRWYFEERGGRLFGRASGAPLRQCARATFARRLRRFAACGLRGGDRRQLALWCEFLRRVAAVRPFSAGNLVWPSRFDACLEACLVRLEVLRRKLEDEDCLRLPTCHENRTEVADAVARRGRRNTFSEARLQQAALCRCALRARRSAALARGPLRAVPGLGSVLRLDRALSGALFAAAGAELASRLLSDFRLLASGELDTHSLAEDALVSSAGASVAAVGRLAAGRLAASRLAAGLACAAAGGGLNAAGVLLELLGPSCAALLAGVLARVVARRLWGAPGARALRCAYTTLGLSPNGVSLYAPEEIEAQLAWMLQQPGGGGRALRLWAAYAYVREHQHPGLRDPWHPSTGPPLEEGSLEGYGEHDLAAAWQVLNLDPDRSHTAAELRKRYSRLLLVHHPDKPAGSPEAFLRLRAAYEALRRSRRLAA